MADETFQLKEAEIEVLDDPSKVLNIYADGAQGFVTVNGVSRFNLYQVVQDLSGAPTPDSVKKIIVARIMMSPETARQVGQWLLDRFPATEGEGEPPASDG